MMPAFRQRACWTRSPALTEAGIEWVAFVDVDPNPTDTNVAAGVVALYDFGLEGVVRVLVGGGSVMDCGKCIAIAAPSSVDDIKMRRFGEMYRRPLPE